MYTFQLTASTSASKVPGRRRPMSLRPSQLPKLLASSRPGFPLSGIKTSKHSGMKKKPRKPPKRLPTRDEREEAIGKADADMLGRDFQLSEYEQNLSEMFQKGWRISR